MADKPKPSKSLKELGDTGTVILAGQLFNPDYNTDLVGDKGLKVYDQMRLGDATVKAALRAVKLPILAADWNVEPASESAEDKAIAEWVDGQLNGMDRPFKDVIREGLNMLDYGRYLFEIVYQLTSEGQVGLKKLSPRLPSTVWAWETSSGQPGIQQMKMDGTKVDIPIERLVIFTNEKEGDNWEGISLLRSAYKHWKMKDALEKIDVMAHERQGLGIPKAKSTSKPSDDDKAQLLERLKNLRANEDDVLYEPLGWEIEFMDMKANTTREPLKSIQYHQFQILLSVLASFLALGSTETGARAVAEDLSDFFEMSLEFIAVNELADPINKYVIRRLVDLNFTVKEYPTIKPDGIGKVDVKQIAETLNLMKGFNTYTPELPIENHLRSLLNLPEAPEDSYYPEPSEKPEPIVLPTGEPDKKEEGKQMSQADFLEHYVKREAEAIRLAIREEHAT